MLLVPLALVARNRGVIHKVSCVVDMYDSDGAAVFQTYGSHRPLRERDKVEMYDSDGAVIQTWPSSSWGT